MPVLTRKLSPLSSSESVRSRCGRRGRARWHSREFFRRSLHRILLSGLAVGVWAGCYSFSGSTLPPHLRTLRLDPVENRTLESALGDRLVRALEDGFRSRTNLRRVNEGGDAVLRTVLSRYSHAPQNTSGEEVTLYRVDILVEVLFTDEVKGDTLYSDNRVPGYGTYSPQRGETEEIGKDRALESLAKVVLDNTISAW